MYKVPAHLLGAVNSIKNEYEAHLSALLDGPVLLKTFVYKQSIEPDYINALVCLHFGVVWWQVTGRSRTLEVASARQAYCYLCRQFTPLKDGEIAQHINRDRTTVVMSVAAVKNFMEVEDEYFCSRMNTLLTDIYQFTNASKEI